MGFAPVYLAQRFFFRVFDFFHHWYVDASRVMAHYFISILEELDRTFAVGITLKYFFHPLYKDYSIVGRLLGPLFRSGRVLIGAAVYLVLGAIFLAFYLAWLAVPPVIVFYAARSL